MQSNLFKRYVMGGATCAALAAAACAHAAPSSRAEAGPEAASARPAPRHAKPKLDLSGRTRIGKASFYSAKFNGRKMADGTRMDPRSDSAASKTLPLGTTAKVTNLETGESAVVTIRDRGPHVPGRIVDLSTASARQAGIDRHWPFRPPPPPPTPTAPRMRTRSPPSPAAPRRRRPGRPLPCHPRTPGAAGSCPVICKFECPLRTDHAARALMPQVP
jgi:rare lipoprotein A